MSSIVQDELCSVIEPVYEANIKRGNESGFNTKETVTYETFPLL
jgi:hypothetical protein